MSLNVKDMSNIQEIWKDIPNYEGLYQASDLGRIKSLIKNKNKILKLAVVKDGYLLVGLRKDSKVNRFGVHRLILYAFVGVDKKPVDHINGVHNDNRLENLRYCTFRENSKFYYEKAQKSSKYVGVHWNKDRRVWRSNIYKNGKNRFLGAFKKEGDARDAYLKALM